MAIIKIGPKHQITIPKDIFKKLSLEVGDILEAEVKGSAIFISPKKLIPKDQAWFWTKEWQEREREAEEDIRKGRVYGPFKNAKELLKFLKKTKF
jgi:AbrB family looped-hinge helix DNA binding protein